MARPTIEIDESQVVELAKLFCTLEDMAKVLKCSVRTLKRRRFGTLINEAQADARTSLRRAQFLGALKGNSTMLVWLGKQYLGQRDRHEIAGRNGGPIAVEATLRAVPDDKLDAEIERLTAAVAETEAEVVGDQATDGGTSPGEAEEEGAT
jgi:hypothetical protein